MIIQTERDTAPLLERIAKIEQRIYTRRHLLAVRSSALVQHTRKKMRYSLASPWMLTLAAVTGFVAQRWVKRNFSRSAEKVEIRRQRRAAKREKKLVGAKRKRVSDDQPSIIGRGLKLIALMRTFIAALPDNWVNSLPGLIRAKVAPAPTAQSPASVPTQARYDGAGIKDR